SRTVAWPTGQTPPRERGWSGFPSILIGRPSRFFTRIPQPALHPEQVDAYQVALPGVTSAGRIRYGTASSILPWLHAARIEAEILNPAAFKKERRVTAGVRANSSMNCAGVSPGRTPLLSCRASLGD